MYLIFYVAKDGAHERQASRHDAILGDAHTYDYAMCAYPADICAIATGGNMVK